MLLGCALGVAQGMCHAVEPDHLAAVSTLVAESHKPRSILRFAAAWGAGHALILLLVGGALLLVGVQMPAGLADVSELAVAAMLVFLGVRALRVGRARRGVSPVLPTTSPRSRRAAIIGMIHGLAGSGAIGALVMARVMSPVVGIAFIALYGLGATLGMSIIAGVAGLPLARFGGGERAPLLLRLTGIISLVVGVSWAWPIARRWLAG